MKHLACLVVIVLGAALAQEVSGFQGTIALGEQFENTLAIDTVDGFITYHTYSFTVPAGVGQVIVTVDGKGSDVDLAVKAGSSILDYGDTDHFDDSEASEHSYTITTPMPNTVYNVEVVNQTDQPINYTLSLTSSEGASGSVATVPMSNVTIGMLEPGWQVEGSLLATDDPEFSTYHTYIIEVPAGSSELIVEMQGERDLDLAIKYGSDISSYDAQDEGGDWLEGDFRSKRNGKLSIANPEAGFWYVDVINSQDQDSGYSIETTIR